MPIIVTHGNAGMAMGEGLGIVGGMGAGMRQRELQDQEMLIQHGRLQVLEDRNKLFQASQQLDAQQQQFREEQERWKRGIVERELSLEEQREAAEKQAFESMGPIDFGGVPGAEDLQYEGRHFDPSSLYGLSASAQTLMLKTAGQRAAFAKDAALMGEALRRAKEYEILGWVPEGFADQVIQAAGDPSSYSMEQIQAGIEPTTGAQAFYGVERLARQYQDKERLDNYKLKKKAEVDEHRASDTAMMLSEDREKQLDTLMTQVSVAKSFEEARLAGAEITSILTGTIELVDYERRQTQNARQVLAQFQMAALQGAGIAPVKQKKRVQLTEDQLEPAALDRGRIQKSGNKEQLAAFDAGFRKVYGDEAFDQLGTYMEERDAGRAERGEKAMVQPERSTVEKVWEQLNEWANESLMAGRREHRRQTVEAGLDFLYGPTTGFMPNLGGGTLRQALQAGVEPAQVDVQAERAAAIKAFKDAHDGKSPKDFEEVREWAKTSGFAQKRLRKYMRAKKKGERREVRPKEMAGEE